MSATTPAQGYTTFEEILEVSFRIFRCETNDATLESQPLIVLLQIHARARKGFRSGKTKSIAYRKQQIAQVGYLIKDNEARFKEALKCDLGRPAIETEL